MLNIKNNSYFDLLYLNSIIIKPVKTNLWASCPRTKNPLILKLKSKLIMDDSTILGSYLKKNLDRIDLKEKEIKTQYLQNKFLIKRNLSDS